MARKKKTESEQSNNSDMPAEESMDSSTTENTENQPEQPEELDSVRSLEVDIDLSEDDVEEESEPEHGIVIPPRRARSSKAITARETGYIVHGLTKLEASPPPKVAWYQQVHEELNGAIEQVITLTACYTQACREEMEGALRDLEPAAAAGHNGAREDMARLRKDLKVLNEHFSTGKLQDLRPVVADVRRQALEQVDNG